MVATICHFGSVDSKTKAKHELSKLRLGLHVDVVPPCSAIARHAPASSGSVRVGWSVLILDLR